MTNRTEITNAYETCCKLAALANQPAPNFVQWGKVFVTPEGSFKLESGFRDTKESKYEDDNGRVRRLPKGKTFHTLTAFVVRVD